MLQVDNPVLLREEITRLKNIIDEKDEVIRQLKEALRPAEWHPPMEIGLTGQEARLTGALFKANGEVVTKQRLLYDLYHDKPETAEIKIVDVYVCKMRKKLRIYGIEIKTHRGQGYYFDTPSIEILKSWGIDSNENL